MAGFHFRDDDLYCDNAKIEDILTWLPTIAPQCDTVDLGNNLTITVDVPTTPVYIYSSRKIQENVKSYLDAMKEFYLAGSLGYAVKANGNLELLKLMRSSGVEMLVTVSGNEVLAGLKAGFPADQILLNGNGKQSWEIKLAIQHGILLNVDSIFDAERIKTSAFMYASGREVKVLLRIHPSAESCSVNVHPFINTAQDSKFGIGIADLEECLGILSSVKNIRIIGLHCHLGSCILDKNVYKDLTDFMTTVMRRLEAKNIKIEVFDVGGGVGVNYRKIIPGLDKNQYISSTDDVDDKSVQALPTVREFVQTIANVIPPNVKVLIEPGRSLVADAGILVTKFLGEKTLKNKQYVIVDAAMTELIRPPLYGAFHEIVPIKLDSTNPWSRRDVAGPVCESADVLGRNILLPHQVALLYLAIMDCGAYAASMGSNYNMRPKPSEVVVTDATYKSIRARETFDNLRI